MAKGGKCWVCDGRGVVILGECSDPPNRPFRLRSVHSARTCRLCDGRGELPRFPARRVESSRAREARRDMNRWCRNRWLFRYWRKACRCIVSRGFGLAPGEQGDV